MKTPWGKAEESRGIDAPRALGVTPCSRGRRPRTAHFRRGTGETGLSEASYNAAGTDLGEASYNAAETGLNEASDNAVGTGLGEARHHCSQQVSRHQFYHQ